VAIKRKFVNIENVVHWLQLRVHKRILAYTKYKHGL